VSLEAKGGWSIFLSFDADESIWLEKRV